MLVNKCVCMSRKNIEKYWKWILKNWSKCAKHLHNKIKKKKNHKNRKKKKIVADIGENLVFKMKINIILPKFWNICNKFFFVYYWVLNILVGIFLRMIHRSQTHISCNLCWGPIYIIGICIRLAKEEREYIL